MINQLLFDKHLYFDRANSSKRTNSKGTENVDKSGYEKLVVIQIETPGLSFNDR